MMVESNGSRWLQGGGSVQLGPFTSRQAEQEAKE